MNIPAPYHTRPVLALCLTVIQGLTCEDATRFAGIKAPRKFPKLKKKAKKS